MKPTACLIIRARQTAKAAAQLNRYLFNMRFIIFLKISIAVLFLAGCGLTESNYRLLYSYPQSAHGLRRHQPHRPGDVYRGTRDIVVGDYDELVINPFLNARLEVSSLPSFQTFHGPRCEYTAQKDCVPPSTESKIDFLLQMYLDETFIFSSNFIELRDLSTGKSCPIVYQHLEGSRKVRDIGWPQSERLSVGPGQSLTPARWDLIIRFNCLWEHSHRYQLTIDNILSTRDGSQKKFEKIYFKPGNGTVVIRK